MPKPTDINPKTGKRYDFVDPRQAAADEAAENRRLRDQVQMFERQQVVLEARERFMPFVKFTSPDFEAPNDPYRSSYKNARHHDAIARVIEEVEKGEYKFLILTMPPRHGKELADSTPVLTPQGWTTHGKLKPGDEVYGEDGKPVRVLAVSAPSWEKMRVQFSNGECLRAHPNHEWKVFDRAKGRWRIMETREIAARTLRSGPEGRGGRYVIQLPDQKGVDFEAKDLELDPYALGVWLGDGATGTGRLDMAACDEAVWRRVEANGLPIGSEKAHPGTGVIRITFGDGKPGVLGPLTNKLDAIGVLRRKHIPEQYLRASRAQRLEILAGLMDTDGHVEQKTGRCRIVSTLPDLVRGIVDLCTTLGFRPYVIEQAAVLSSSGVQGRNTVFTVGFQPHESIPTSLPKRHVKVFARRRRVSVTAVDVGYEEPGRCIQIDRANGIYLAGRTLVPTHNSEIVSRKFPAWYSGRHPEHNIVVATYNDDFAMDFGKNVRDIMRTPQYKNVFPNHGLKKGGAASDRLETTRGGLLSFVGLGGSLTGRGAHLLIVDDLIKSDKEAGSPAMREHAWNWFTKVAMTRRMGKKLVVMTFTRWNADDPIGRLTDPENPKYDRQLAEEIKIINLPALAEEDDPLGRAPGEALWPNGPDKFDVPFLKQMQRLDPMGFAALYQQRPSAIDGELFRREKVQYYDPDKLPADVRVYAASDHAVGVKQRNDPSCFLKVAVDKQNNIYVLPDLVWKRIPTDVAVEEMLRMAAGKHRPLYWWAERGHISKSIGPFLYKRMQETGVYLNVVEVTPANDKEQRAQSIAARFAMGKVLFPRGAWWVEKAINEMMAFPNGRNDDFVDALAYIGLGLQAQFGPTARAEVKTRPAYGTLAWVKENDNWAAAKRRAAASGGF